MLGETNGHALETRGVDKEVGLHHQFGITTYGGNGDLSLEIDTWKDRDSNAELRLYSGFGGQIALNTYSAFSLLKSILDGNDVEFERKKFLRAVTIKNQEGELTIEHIKGKVILTMHQLIESGIVKKCDRKASVIIVKEGTMQNDDLVIDVQTKVFECLAYIQHEMKKDRKDDIRIYK